MNEYVTKAKVIKAIEKAVAPEIITIGDHETIGVFTRESIEQIVSNLPAADVAEVRYGRWIKHKCFDECSECYTMVILRYNYCPNCGARMGKENEHETN